MQVIGYVRVSTDEQTIEPQILDLKAYCDRQGGADERGVEDGGRAARAFPASPPSRHPPSSPSSRVPERALRV